MTTYREGIIIQISHFLPDFNRSKETSIFDPGYIQQNPEIPEPMLMEVRILEFADEAEGSPLR